MKNSLSASIRAKLLQQAPMAFQRAVILTALREEYEAVRGRLANLRERVHDRGTVYELGDLPGTSGFAWEICIAEIGATNPNAAQEAERAIGYFKPAVAMFVGVAGGLKDVSIGDVVVATKVYGYESGKAESRFRTRPEVRESSYDLEQRARAVARNEDWVAGGQVSERGASKVHLGPIASGEKVVASRDSDFYRFLQENYGDALAVEMEGWGFLGAVRSHPEVRAVVVRGISDLIEGKSEADAGGSQSRAARNAARFALNLLARYRPPGISIDRPATIVDHFIFEQNTDVENLIKGLALGDWDSAAHIALRVIQSTSPSGGNILFDSLIKYYNCPDEDMRWAAMTTIESAISLSPSLINRNTLVYLASHPDFSVRSSAASICMDLANFAPALVPVDILIPLSLYSEDWYVQAPANAALKTLAHSMPQIRKVFIERLQSNSDLEREHATDQLVSIAWKEPELLDHEELLFQAGLLRELGDDRSATRLMEIIPRVKASRGKSKYRYGI